jgi:hypothetical protein
VYLSANYTSKQALFGGSVIRPTPPVQIGFVTDALDWGYAGGAQTAASLRSTANYLYWLCGMFQLQAQNIISGSGGGSVSPNPPSGTLPNPFDYEVTGSSTPLANGESSVVLTTFIGYNIAFNRSNIPQSVVNTGASYYSWNRVTGAFQCFPAAVSGEIFQIIPIG